MSGDGRRVLIFDRGLANNYSLGLARGLEQLGMNVVIAGSAGSPDHGVVPVYPREGVMGHKTAKAVEAAKGSWHLWRLVRRWRPDVVHFQWSGMSSYVLARVFLAVTTAPLVYTVHNPVPRGWEQRWQPRMVRNAHALIVHGPSLRDELLRRLPVSADSVHIVPHGNYEHAITRHDRVEARRRLGLPEESPVFAFVGQLTPRKGIETLLKAFRVYCSHGHSGTLVIVGPVYGVDLGALRSELSPYEQRVRWRTSTGGVPADELDLVASAATQVVLPFHEASQSGSVIYAMTHGRCVVTTALGELPRTVGDNGLIVPPADELALASAMEIAANDPELCDRLGRAAREFVLDELDWSRIAALTLRVYDGALESRDTIRPGGAEVAERELARR